MRFPAIVLILAVLSGCAAPERVKFATSQDGLAKSTFKLVDARPPAPERSEQGMFMIWRDEQFEPRPAALVEHAVRRSKGTMLEGATVVLKEFTVHYTRTEIQQSPMASHNAFMYGAIGAGMTALLDAAMSPDHCSVKVVVEVNGVAVTATATDSVSKYAPESGVQRVVEQALERLTELVASAPPTQQTAQQ